MIKIKQHRQFSGIIKSATISKTPADKYYISILIDEEEIKLLPKSSKHIGVDLGLKSFAVFSDGTSKENPKWLRKTERQLNIAHGSDTIMFFQLRRSRGACEKYHGALIAHAGHENTRVFKECQQLGEELKILEDKLLDSRPKSRVAIMFDWDNWWAVEFSSGPSIDLKYVGQVEKYYNSFFELNIPVDIIKPDSDLSKYDIVVAPVLYMIKPGVVDSIEKFVKNGGTFVTTFFSGLVDENDLVTLGGYPGELRNLLGIWVEEVDALYTYVTARILKHHKT